MSSTRLVAVVVVVLLAGVGATMAVRLTGGGFTPTPAQRTAFVESQAKANCLVQRTVYPTREALAAAYDEVVLGAGLDAATVKRMQDVENRDSALRGAITARVKQLCG